MRSLLLTRKDTVGKQFRGVHKGINFQHYFILDQTIGCSSLTMHFQKSRQYLLRGPYNRIQTYKLQYANFTQPYCDIFKFINVLYLNKKNEKALLLCRATHLLQSHNHD